MSILTWQPKVEHFVFIQLTGVKNRVIDDSRSVVVVGQPLVDLGDGRRDKQTLTPKVTRAVNTTVIQVWYRRDLRWQRLGLCKAAVSLEITYYNPVSHKLCIINVWHCSYFTSNLNITIVFWQCWGTVMIVFTAIIYLVVWFYVVSSDDRRTSYSNIYTDVSISEEMLCGHTFTHTHIHTQSCSSVDLSGSEEAVCDWQLVGIRWSRGAEGFWGQTEPQRDI